MTAKGRLPRFDLRSSNGRIQRAPAVTAAPSKVGKLIRQQPLAGTMVGAIRPVSGPHSGQPSEGKLDGGEGDKRGQGFDEVLKVLGKPPVAAKPREGTLDHPAARQHDEALCVVAPFDNLQAQRGHFRHRGVNLPRAIAAISPDQFEPREAAAYLVEDETSPVTVLDRRRMDNDPHRQPFAVDQGVDLATLHPLAGVVTHLVVFTAPFSADLTDWLSRTAADGLAPRPIRSRNAICNSAQIASQTPSR